MAHAVPVEAAVAAALLALVADAVVETGEEYIKMNKAVVFPTDQSGGVM